MRRFAYVRYGCFGPSRDRRFVLFSFGFPLVLYFLIAGPNRGEQDLGDTGISLPLYYMVGLAAFGAMVSMVASGGRIASERTTGWTRQLRTTPLSPRAYFTAKVVTAYATALLGVLLLYAAGAILGVRLPAADWLAMTGLIVVALLPFAALEVLVGHLVTIDSVGALAGGLTSVLTLMSGNWFPLGEDGFLHDTAQFLPSYWLVQASRVGLGGWEATGWIVVIAWTVVLAALAYWAYRRTPSASSSTRSYGGPVSRYEVLLFLHVLAAFATITVVVLLTTVAVGIRGAGAGAAPLLRLSGLARRLWDVAGFGTLVFGIWLALDLDDYGLFDGWIIAAIVLWVVAAGTGTRVGQAFLEASQAGEADPSLLARTRVPHAVMAIAVAALLVIMIYKPGA